MERKMNRLLLTSIPKNIMRLFHRSEGRSDWRPFHDEQTSEERDNMALANAAGKRARRRLRNLRNAGLIIRF